MSTDLEDNILFLYASDGSAWANFLSTRLADKNYGLSTTMVDITTPSNNKEVEDDAVYENPKSSINNEDKIIYLAKSKKASVIFLSPDLLEGVFPVSIEDFDTKRTVFLFLGVDREEARLYFGEKDQHLSQCRICLIDANEASITDAMVEIIQAFEYTEVTDEDEDQGDVYSFPPSSKQFLTVDRVFPKVLTEAEREVFILLPRAAEDEVTLVLEVPKPQRVPLNSLDKRLYSFTMPDDLHGNIYFHLECQGQKFGNESVTSLTRLEQVKEVIESEINPISLLASAMGISTPDLGGIDTALAFKLQELSPLMTFKQMFPCESALNGTVSKTTANVKWPSLLHFSADLNLRTFCCVLLRYPGMYSAACTPNSDGEKPLDIARRKGYRQIEDDLTQFENAHQENVEGREKTDPTEYVEHRPCSDTEEDYVNNGISPYTDMKQISPRNPTLGIYQNNSDSGVFVHLDKGSSSNGMSNKSSSTDKDKSMEYINMEAYKQNISVSDSKLNSQLSTTSDPFDSPEISPREGDFYGTTARKALKTLGVNEDDIIRSRSPSGGSDSSRRSTWMSSTQQPHVSGMSPECDSLSVNSDDHHSCDIDDLRKKKKDWIFESSKSVYDATIPKNYNRFSVSSNCDDEKLLAIYYRSVSSPPDSERNSGSYEDEEEDPQIKSKSGKDSKSKSIYNHKNYNDDQRKGNKVISFITKKLKGANKRSTSDGDVQTINVKKSPSTRSTDSEKLANKKATLAMEQLERDSGSFSDEDKDQSKQIRKAPLRTRRLSVRTQNAMREKIEHAPSVPKRSSFTSYIKE